MKKLYLYEHRFAKSSRYKIVSYKRNKYLEYPEDKSIKKAYDNYLKGGEHSSHSQPPLRRYHEENNIIIYDITGAKNLEHLQKLMFMVELVS